MLPVIRHTMIEALPCIHTDVQQWLLLMQTVSLQRAKWSANGKVVQHESKVNTILHSKATTALFNSTGWRGKVAKCKCDSGNPPPPFPDCVGRLKACCYEILNQLGNILGGNYTYIPHTIHSSKHNVIVSHDFAHVSTKKLTLVTK